MRRYKSLAGFAVAGLTAGIVAVTAFSATQARENDSRDAARDSGPEAGRTERVAPRCLEGDRVGRFQVVDDHTVVVYDDFGNPYKLDVGGPCRGMNQFTTFGFEFRGSSSICKAHDATLLRMENPGLGTMRCIINGVESISRAEADALDKG